MVDIPLTATFQSPHTVPVKFIKQAPYKYLCWAACTAMVNDAAARKAPAQYQTLPKTVPAVAQQVQRAGLGGECALGGEVDGQASFDQTCYPQCALIDVFNLTCRPLGGTVEERTLIDEIDTYRRPAMLYIQWDGYGSHVLLLIGYARHDDGFIYFDVCDPLTESIQQFTHDDLLSYKQSGSWQNTYADVGIAL